MAYTYEQFESEARKTDLLDKFDKQDLIIAQSNPEYGISMLQLMKNRNGATTSEQKILADEAVRQLRQTYGGYVSGGRLPEYADEVIQQTDNYYAGQSAYRRQLAEAEGYGSHSYDEKLGDIYARQNNLERERSRADALAAASARTGGVPSSYALMLAQQAGNESDAQLDATILGLRKNAYQEALAKATKPTVSGGTQSVTVKKPVVSGGTQSTTVQDSTGTNNVNNNGGGQNDSLSKYPDAYYEDSKPIGKQPTGTFTIIHAPTETAHTKALAESIDGNIAIWKMQGLSDAQLREKIIGMLSRDGFVRDMSDGEWKWLLEYYKKYHLV